MALHCQSSEHGVFGLEDHTFFIFEYLLKLQFVTSYVLLLDSFAISEQVFACCPAVGATVCFIFVLGLWSCTFIVICWNSNLLWQCAADSYLCIFVQICVF